MLAAASKPLSVCRLNEPISKQYVLNTKTRNFKGCERITFETEYDDGKYFRLQRIIYFRTGIIYLSKLNIFPASHGSQLHIYVYICTVDVYFIFLADRIKVDRRKTTQQRSTLNTIYALTYT